MLHLRPAIVIVAGSLFQAPAYEYPSVLRNSNDYCFEFSAFFHCLGISSNYQYSVVIFFKKTYLQSFYMKHAVENDTKTMLAKHTQHEHQGETTLRPDLCCVIVFFVERFFTQEQA